jgi:hypothetical protein
MVDFYLAETGVTSFQIYPEFNYNRSVKQIKSETRMQSGKLFRHLFANYEVFTFDLNFIPASQAIQINSWYQSGSEIQFNIDSGGAIEVNSVQILNDNSPFGTFIEPYDNLYEGQLRLETY